VQRTNKRFCLSVAALAVLASTIAVVPAMAEKSLPGSPLAKVDKNQPMMLQADELVHDSKRETVTARGHVEIYYDKFALFADRVIYDKKANTLTAAGNVRIKEPDGALVTAEVITLTSDFRDGFIRGLKAVTKESARFGAAHAYRKDNETTVFEGGHFTPCKPCENDPEAAPAWRVRAEKITEVKSEGNIYFENATFEVFGVPTLWVPYFYMPDPSVARRSGFLMPVYGASTNLGYFVGTPYYFALSASYDLTVTPEFTTKAGDILRAAWRQRLKNGVYKIDFVGAYNANPTSDVPDNAKFRGSIKSAGEFNFNRYWKWGWDATLESDKTFRRYYGIDGILATDRISKLYVEGQRDRNYFSAQLYEFGTLTPEYTQTTSPGDSQVLPVIDYNYVFGQPVLGGELSFDANAFSLTRNNGTELNQVVGEAKWRRTVIAPLGQAITPFVHGRADLYQFSNYQQDSTTVVAKDGTIGRGSFAAGVDYRYPLIKHAEDASFIVEPIGQVIYRPDLNNQSAIPNEDAQSLVFDDTLLFDTDKFSGYDRVETGTRANVGFQTTVHTHTGWTARFVAGESIQIAGENPFPVASGLYQTRSDYVTGAYLDLPQHLRIMAQTRFDPESFSLNREDVSVATAYGPLTASVGYVYAKNPMLPGLFYDRSEVISAAAMQIDNKWSLFGNLRFNLTDEQFITDSVGVKYSDDCYVLSVTYAENYVQDLDIKPSKSVLVRFNLKGLGGFTGSDRIEPSTVPQANMLN
jgi:LPS-assembly protein